MTLEEEDDEDDEADPSYAPPVRRPPTPDSDIDMSLPELDDEGLEIVATPVHILFASCGRD